MAYLSSDIEDMARWAGLEGTESIDELLDQVHRDKQRVPRILVSIVNAIAAKSKRMKRLTRDHFGGEGAFGATALIITPADAGS